MGFEISIKNVTLHLLLALKLSSFVQCLPLWQDLSAVCGCAHLLKMHMTYEESIPFQIPDSESETEVKKRMYGKIVRREG